MTCPRCHAENERFASDVPHLSLEIWTCAECGASFTKPSTPPLILNVDDRPPSLYARSRMLRMNGFTVTDVTTGEDARVAAVAMQPHVILLDVHLPDADGRRLCREIRSNAVTKHIPVVLISATLHAREVADPAEWGAAGFLREPVDSDTLAATLRRAIGTT